MPNFRARICKHIISNVSNPLGHSYEEASIFASSLMKLRRFSSGGREMDPPEPIPNRPLRGQRSPPPNRSSPDNDRRQNIPNLERRVNPNPNPNPNPNRNSSPPPLQDSGFLEKLKMGLEKSKREKPQVPEEPPPQQQLPEEANEIFKKMKETGLIPNAVAMLDGLCKDGLVQEAMKLFGLMREKGTIPEVVIYTAVVEGFGKAQKPEDAKRIFRKMQTNGIVPNAFSYTVLIQGLCRCGQLEDAIEFCGEMLEVGHSPNVTTFVGLVDGVCKENGVEEAQSLIGKLKQKGYLVNEKAVREFLDKRASFSPMVWEAIFGKNHSKKMF